MPFSNSSAKPRDHSRLAAYNTLMDTLNYSRRGQLIFAIFLITTGLAAYFNYRQQVFEVFASGTQWVLVTCGFVPEDDGNIQNERLRKLYYAARMFNETPAKELSSSDQLAADLYPDMGFGLTHTFDTHPVSAIIGGWLFSIPCTYFIDSRDCNKTLTTARLKVNIGNFKPITFETIELFLSAASPELVHVTISNIESWPQRSDPNNAQIITEQNGYKRYQLQGSENNDELLCTDLEWATLMGVMDHCLLRFNYGDDTVVQLKFSSTHRNDSERIKRGARQLVSSFQVRQ